MRKRGVIVMLTAAVGLAALTMADAQGRRGPGGMGLGPGGPGMGRGLLGLPGVELTDAQRQQIRAIVQEERPDRIPAHLNLHRQLRAELLADAPDEQKVAALRDQLAHARTEMLAREIDVQRKIAQVLTADQRAKARDAIAKAPEGRRGRVRGGDDPFRF